MGRQKKIIRIEELRKAVREYESLQKNLDNAIFTENETLLNEIKQMNRRQILKQHPYSISQYKDGRWKTYIDVTEDVNGTLTTKRKQIAKPTREAVEEEIINRYVNNLSGDMKLSDAFVEWIKWRNECAVDPKTILENMNDWNKYIAKDKIASKKIKDLKPFELEDFFFRITANHQMTNTRFTCVKGVINGILNYEVRNDTLVTNPLLRIDFAALRGRFKPVSSYHKTYTDEERNKILDYLKDKNEPYYLAISLAFCMCLRIGELSALKPEDIENGELLIRRSQRRFRKLNSDLTLGPVQYSYEERLKGNQAQGFRSVPISDRAKEILDRTLKAMAPGQEFLFMSRGKPILSDSFNERLHKVCNDLNIEYRPSHQIRFSMATKLCEAGVPVNQLSVLLGHSETKTTYHYIRQQHVDSVSSKIFNAVCG